MSGALERQGQVRKNSQLWGLAMVQWGGHLSFTHQLSFDSPYPILSSEPDRSPEGRDRSKQNSGSYPLQLLLLGAITPGCFHNSWLFPSVPLGKENILTAFSVC